MLTPADDYPLHQTAEPIAHPGSGDRNHYDRYFFNGVSAAAVTMVSAPARAAQSSPASTPASGPT